MFAPFEKKGPARAIVRALGHRGGADSSVDFAPCQDPFFSPTEHDFRGHYFSDLHETSLASRPTSVPPLTTLIVSELLRVFVRIAPVEMAPLTDALAANL